MPEFNDWFPESIHGTDHVNVKGFGAIGAGQLNTMTNLGYANLAAAQADYPKATAMTDSADWCGIQAAIDYALNPENNPEGPALGEGIYHVLIPEGVYYVTDTIHVGYGMTNGVGTYHCVMLVGANRETLGTHPGAIIRSTFMDRPIINIQSAIGGGVKGLRVEGPTAPPIPSFGDLVARANPANYVPAGAVDNEYAPFCGICIDGYTAGPPFTEDANNPPPVPYPTPRFPSWVQSTTNAYNKVYSTRPKVEDCQMVYCNIGIAQQPYVESNADFSSFSRCDFYGLKIAFLICNSQARNMEVSNVTMSYIHTAFQSTGYGHGVGNLQGTYDNVSCSVVYRLIHGLGGWSQPVAFNSLYGESMMILGDFVGGKLTFESCSLSCQDMTVTAQQGLNISNITWAGGTATATTSQPLANILGGGWTSGTRTLYIIGSPSTYGNGNAVLCTWVDNTHFSYPIASDPGTFVAATFNLYYISQWWNEPFLNISGGGNAVFRNCNFSDHYIFHFIGKVQFENVSFAGHAGIDGDTSLLPPGHRLAVEAFNRVIVEQNTREMAGVEIFSGVNNALFGRLQGGTSREQVTSNYDGYNSYQLNSMWGRGQKDVGYRFDYDVPTFCRYGIGSIGTFGTISGITRTAVTSGALDGHIQVGDVIWMENHPWYAVESVAGSNVTVRQITNFSMSSNVYTSFDSATGNPFYFPIGQLDLYPAFAGAGDDLGNFGLFMKTTVGSPAITFVTYEGNAETPVPRPAGIVLTSRPLWTGVSAQFWANTLPFPEHTYINSFPDANTITMTNNALVSGTWAYGPGIKRLK